MHACKFGPVRLCVCVCASVHGSMCVGCNLPILGVCFLGLVEAGKWPTGGLENGQKQPPNLGLENGGLLLGVAGVLNPFLSYPTKQ